MNHRPIPLLLLLSLLAACAPEPAPAPPETTPERSYVNPRTPDDGDVLPFSGGVMVGDTFYVSGNLGLGPDQTVPDTPQEEARNVLTNVQATLEAAGLTMDDLVMVQVYSSDVADYAAFNEVYRTFFTTEFPARAYLGSGTLLYNARFEVLGIAVKR